MLGQGLESLIPPAKGGGQDDDQNVDPAGLNDLGQNDQDDLHVDAQADDARMDDALQVDIEEEKLLPAAEPEPEIEAPPEEELLSAAQPPAELPVSPTLEPEFEIESPLSPETALPQSDDSNASTDTGESNPALASEVVAQHQAATRHGHGGKQRSEAVFYLEVDKISPNQHQPRRHFDEDGLNELAASIREFGVLQPLVVTKIEKEVPDGTEVEYELIAGERRLLAAKRAGLERVPAIVRAVSIPQERLELAVIENIQRENLTPIEMARAFARLQDEFRLTQREIAARLGKSREAVANTLRLLDLPAYIQEAIGKNQISESHGRLLLTVDDPAAQQALFHDLLNQNLTTRELRRRTTFLKNKNKLGGADGAGLDAASQEVKYLEEKLASALSAPVKIKSKGGSGKITIDFFSSEELGNIMRRLGGGED